MKLSKNENKTDRLIRAILAIIFLLAGFFYLTGIIQIISYILSAGLFFTAISGFCGIYTLLGINTCRLPNKK